MEKSMKQTLVMIAAIVVTFHIAAAQSTGSKFTSEEQLIVFASQNLMKGLTSGNYGIMESSMKIAVQMKQRYPNADMTEITTLINEIRRHHPSGSLRYKAYIAQTMCEHPELYLAAAGYDGTGAHEFFLAASERMRAQLLSVNAE